MRLHLYFISQSYDNGYDTYDSAVVAAPDAVTAARMHPQLNVPVEHVTVRLIGESDQSITKYELICSSFNPG